MLFGRTRHLHKYHVGTRCHFLLSPSVYSLFLPPLPAFVASSSTSGVLTFILVCPQKGTKSATVNTGRRPSDSERGYRAAARRALPCGSDASDPIRNEPRDDRRVTHGEDARQTRTDWKTIRSWKRPEDQRKGGEGGQEDAHLLDLQIRKEEVNCLQVGLFSCPVRPTPAS